MSSEEEFIQSVEILQFLVQKPKLSPSILRIYLRMTTANTKWNLEGDYFEGCNCDSYAHVYLRETLMKAFAI